MKAKDNIFAIFITIIFGVLILFVSTKGEHLAAPAEVFKVYLNGKALGYVNSQNELLDIIDKKQEEIKNKYKVNKVYPPIGLKIEKLSTYSDDIKSADEIYQMIDKNGAFTIDGYQITIKYDDKEKKPLYVYTLDKSFFEEAFYNTVAAFVGSEQLEKYKNNAQDAIKDEGSKIESIYWDENITVKKSLINAKENIFTSTDDLSKYLLFGTTEKQKSYIVKDGDTIDDIIDKNNLSIEEFLVANPSIPDKDILLSKDQEVSIGLIEPVVTIVHEQEVVEKIIDKYDTEYKTDSSLYVGTTKVIQDGSNGTSKVTEKIQYKNGEIMQLYITKSEEITPTVNKIVARGTKSYPNYNYNYDPEPVSGDWYWPTIKPYIKTSGFGWRWGKHHNGIDISGCGFGSPIYSATTGTVVEVVSGCADTGWYGSSCGSYWGNHVMVMYNGYKVIYAHLRSDVKVRVGDTVSRGQKIGTMGSSGSSTGTHLHFGIMNPSGNYINPCSVYSC